MADAELIVRLRGENADLKSKLAEVTAASKTTAGGMSSVFGSALGSIAGAVGAAFSVAKIIEFGKQSVQAFSESQAAATSLANTISNLGGSSQSAKGIQAMVDNLEKMSGFDDSDISQAFRDLYTQTGNQAKATEALNVAMDMAAIEHISVASAATNVHNVMLGLSRTMKNYGMTVREGASDMDYLRELSAKMANGLTTNLTTIDGKTRTLKTSFDNLKESLGGVLAEMMSPAMDKLTKLFQDIGAGQEWDNYLKSLDDDGKRRMEGLGALMGKEWVAAFLNNVQGASDLTDVAVGAFDKSSKGGGVQEAIDYLKTYKSTVSSTADTFKAAWSPISMVGGNLPELTKYIGNLRQASKLNLDVNINIKGGGSIPAGSSVSQAANTLAQAIAPKVAVAITHGQGWTPTGGNSFKESR